MLANQLKLKLSDAYRRIRTLEFEIQEKVSHIHLLEERLGLNVSISFEEEKEKKTNGKL